MHRSRLRIALPLLLCGLCSDPTAAKVAALDFVTEDVLHGRTFGSAGAYQRLSGWVEFEFDPDNVANRAIVDLDKAPVNAGGSVQARANFMVLRPKTPCARHCVGLLEVSNRGGKAALAYFNKARFSNNPVDEDQFGDGFLLRRGLTLIWIGWQFDVPPGGDRLRLQVPVAKNAGQTITGLVRSDWTVDSRTHTLPLAHRDHIAYPVADTDDPRNRLTRRAGRLGQRRLVPRKQWRFADGDGGTASAELRHIYLPGGTQPGHIYELVYVAEDPALVGLGLAAVRDMMSHAKYHPDSPFPVSHGVALGISQTGRFLRHFIYQEFNRDEAGRKVFDGMLIHSAGAGRGSFNHRFAQPSRDAHRYSAFFYPTDLFPFSGRVQRDPHSGRREGLFQGEPSLWPKVFYTNTGYEYWGRGAALIHTSADGQKDIATLPNERIYHIAAAQHFVGRMPPSKTLHTDGLAAFRGNPLDFHPHLRALLWGLIDWATTDTAPPPSRYPRIEDGSLVAIQDVRFPTLPGIAYPRLAHQAYRIDYGPRWRLGIIDRQPPLLGAPFAVRVPQVDRLGNELGGIRGIELQVPLASYFPWALRLDYPAATDELVDFFGTTVPFTLARTEDPRPALAELYPTLEVYMARIRRSTKRLIEQGLLLAEDRADIERHATALWDWVHRLGNANANR